MLLFMIVSFLTMCSIGSSADTSLDHPFTESFTKLSHAPCISLYYRNGRVGCGTEDHSVSIGELKYFDGALPQNQQSPYVILVEDYDLTAETLDTLSAARGGLLHGILVVNSTKDGDNSNSNANSKSSQDTNVYYSPDSRTPQGYDTPMVNLNYGYNAYPWNSKGENLFQYNLYGVPMAYVSDSDVAASLREESQVDGGNSAIVAEFNYYMGPNGINSKDCLQWKDVAGGAWNPKCLPLGGTSIWSTAGSPSSKANRRLNNYNNRSRGLDGDGRQIVLLTAGMDATSMFHDISPGANTAASNILTIMMAAKLVGANMDDDTLDNLPKRIVFALFEGESYGFLGSRLFLRDLEYPGFQCNSDAIRSIPRLDQKSEYACLFPLRQSLIFQNLGQIAGMISVDQVGHVVSDGILYVHADQNNDEYGYYLANLLKYCSTSSFSVTVSSAVNKGNGYPYPPSPLTSLLNLSEGAKGGVLLTGYDYAFTGKVPYHSHHDSASVSIVNLKSIAAAATILARGVVAAAFDDGSDENGGYENAAYYAKNKIPELSYQDESLVELSNCLFYDGSCNLISKYSDVETANARASTGLALGSGVAFPNPPSFYVGVYNHYYGQPFVQVGDNTYGAYDGNDFGKKNSDAVAIVPPQLESALHGMFNDFLGRGSNANAKSTSCKKASDCANVDICQADGDAATCTGSGVCVCKRAHYHVALDEALVAAANEFPGHFRISDDDREISPIFVEPYWSSSVGVRVYRDVGSLPGFFTLVAGLVVGAVSMFSALVLKVGLKKEKLY